MAAYWGAAALRNRRLSRSAAEVKNVMELARASDTQAIESTASGTSVWHSGKHCAELDGVRGIAILMVTLYRFAKEVDTTAHPALAFLRRIAPIGERGVDLFFVLSGFLITGILLHSKARDGYFRNFFARRSLRIFPLYFTALAVCLWLLPTIFSIRDFDKPCSEQIYLWTYTANIRMSWANEWCFGPLDHFWSLAVEEHFYLVWPFVVFFLSDRSLLRLSFVLILLVGGARTVAATNPDLGVAINVLTIFRLDGLCCGAALAVLLRNGLNPSHMKTVASWSLPIMFAMAIAVAILGIRLLGLPHTLFPAMCAILLGLLLTRPSEQWMRVVTRMRIFRWLGKYSYGMYIVQLPLLSVVTPDFARGCLGNSPLIANLIFVPTMVLLTMLLGFLTYHLLEKHFLKLKSAWV